MTACMTDFTMSSIFAVPNIQKNSKTSLACVIDVCYEASPVNCHCTAAFNPLEQYKVLANDFLNVQEGLEN